MSFGFRGFAAALIIGCLALLALTAQRLSTPIGITAGLEVMGLFAVLKLLAPKRFAWAGRVFAALVFVGFAAAIADAVRLGQPWGWWVTGLVVLGLPALSYAGFGAWWRPQPVYLDHDDPLILAAVTRARVTVPELRRLFAERPDATFVKVPEEGGEGWWCEVVSLDEASAQVRDARSDELVRVPLETIVDWMVELPSGQFRGNFSSAAVIAACERDGRVIPDALERLRPLLVDAAAA